MFESVHLVPDQIWDLMIIFSEQSDVLQEKSLVCSVSCVPAVSSLMEPHEPGTQTSACLIVHEVLAWKPYTPTFLCLSQFVLCVVLCVRLSASLLHLPQ